MRGHPADNVGGTQAALILRDARTPIRVCRGSATARSSGWGRV